MKNMKIISLGGSIVAPEKPDVDFIKNLKKIVVDYLNEDKTRSLIFIIGGGGHARIYQQASREIFPEITNYEMDLIGIAATRINAQLVKGIFGDLACNHVIIDPTADFVIDKPIAIAAGWKPGFSTDTDAVYLAERFGADTVINLSNISKIYSADPKLDKNAVPLDTLTWDDFIKMTGTEWIPGKNTPFDPVAAVKAQGLGLKVITAGGKDLTNIKKILEDKPFEGSTITK
ncbi:MAG: UMP kinase [Spirochaetales bacterium]|nr:UMP kinase [Spirochaetales bacterium]